MKRFFFILVLIFAHTAFSATQEELEKQYFQIDHLPETKEGFSRGERQALFKLARHNKVAALEKLNQYDPSGQVGFCFGRAMTVDLIARKMGLKIANIRKLFVIGDLRQTEDPEWRFHVTTLVKGDDGGWYAVDPIMEPPLAMTSSLKIEDWMRIVQTTWDKEKHAHFYMVEASAIIPDLREVPAPDKETGKNIIEVSFLPENKPTEFTAQTVGGRTYFTMSPTIQDQYFMTVYENVANDRFPFLNLTINTAFFDFYHYFEDLLEDLKP